MRQAAHLQRAIDARLRFRRSTDICALSGMIRFNSLGGLRRKLQGVDETALGQFDLEAILALRFCVAQRRIGRFSENCWRRWLIC